MRLLYSLALYHAYLMLPHRASVPLHFGTVFEGANIPECRVGFSSDSRWYGCSGVLRWA